MDILLRHSQMACFSYGSLLPVAGSALPVAGAALFLFFPEELRKSLVSLFISYATGALLGASLCCKDMTRRKKGDNDK
ncbi:MAG: hypothetical protein M1497_12795 [Nitrospirae bacterium]|nr:hypothetical protein [Nitrospirota bacterium]